MFPEVKTKEILKTRLRFSQTDSDFRPAHQSLYQVICQNVKVRIKCRFLGRAVVFFVCIVQLEPMGGSHLCTHSVLRLFH